MQVILFIFKQSSTIKFILFIKNNDLIQVVLMIYQHTKLHVKDDGILEKWVKVQN